MPAPRLPDYGTYYAWDGQNYLPTTAAVGGALDRDAGGEDWWYGHCNLYDTGGNLIGFAAAGYNTVPEWGAVDENGCFDHTSDGWRSDEFETAAHRKGSLRQWLARYDTNGNMIWCKSYLMGVFYGVIQGADGSIMAIGEASTNRRSTIATTANPWPIQYNPGLTASGDVSMLDCNTAGLGGMNIKPCVLKTDLEGNVIWQNFYGWPTTNAEGWSIGGRGWAIERAEANGEPIYYAACSGGLAAASREHAYLLRIQENGELLDRHVYVADDPALGLIGQTVVEQMRPLGMKHAVIDGKQRLVVSGQYRITTASPAINRAFLWYFDDLDLAPYAPSYGQITSNAQLGGIHHSLSLIQQSTSATLIDNGGTPSIIWPVLSDYAMNTDVSAGRSIATLKIHRFDPPDPSPTWTSDLGEVRAYDLQADAMITSDGNIAVVSTKWQPPYDQNDPFRYNDLTTTTQTCLSGFPFSWNGSDIFDYWNTNAYVAKLSSINGSTLWETNFDAEPNVESGCFPEDMRKQECLYRITETDEAGLLISGNTSHNFDDAYLAKLGPDCQAKVNYEPLTLVDGAYTLTSNETWSTDRKIFGTIVVPDGKILTINNNATIRFADSEQLAIPTRLIVKPGGVLNVVNATLSSLDQCPNSMWDGIVLQGDANADQGSGTVGLDQAYLNVTNSTIENARTAVVVANAFQMGSLSDVPNELRSGGIVRTVDASFHNNIYDVSFSPYENHINSAVANNRSSFVRTKFETVGLLADPEKVPVYHATLALVRGILFSGCTFSNDLSGQMHYGCEDRGWGIRSISSSFRVQAHCNVPLAFGVPCAEANLVRSRFQGLHRGIRATTMDLSRTFSVSKAIFTDVHLGIRMDGIQDAAITETSFSIPRALHDDEITTTYGIYSEQCTGYRIESNSFASMDGDPEPRRAGIAIRNSGDNYNTFYNNSFDGLKLGSVIQGDNANEKFTAGLEVKCNDYGLSTKNKFDVALTSYDATIQRNQGAAVQNPLTDIANPAGNRFSAHNETDHPESDWYVGASNYVEYFFHTPTPGNRTKPEYSNNPLELNLTDVNAGWPGKATACPTAFTRPKSQLREASGLAHEGLEDAKADYDATKDDGDTYSLLAYVEDPANSSLQVRNALQSVAPKVSAEVWQAAFERNPVMQPWHITQALLSNSPLQGEVLKMVETYALPSYYADLVYSGQDGDANLLTILQAEVAKYAAEKAEALTDLGHQSWLDSLDLSGSLDSLKLWHLGLPSDNSGITIAGVLSAQRDLAALELLAQMEEQSSTAPALYAVVKRFAEAEQQGGWNRPVADITYLEALATQREPFGSALAYGWLEALGQQVPEEIILHPEDTPKRLARQGNQPVQWPTEVQLTIFPNPSNGPVFVGYDVPTGTGTAVLRVIDLSGRELQSMRISEGPGLSTIETEGWANGVYIAEIRLDGAAHANTKFTILR